MKPIKQENIIKTSTNFYEILKALVDGKEVIATDESFGYYLRADKTIMYKNRVVDNEATEILFKYNVPFFICEPVKTSGEMLCKNIKSCDLCPLKWLCKNTNKAQLISKSEMCLYNILDILTKDAPDAIRGEYLKLLDKEV